MTRQQDQNHSALLRGIALLIVLVVLVAASILSESLPSGARMLLFSLLPVLAGFLTYRFASRNAAREAAERKAQTDALARANHSLALVQQRMEMVRQLNNHLAEARSEKELIETALDLIADLTGAVGSSFVPLDELGQPLPSFSRGKLPGEVMQAWAEHLTAPEVRERCAECQKLHTAADADCPLAGSPFFNAVTIDCIRVIRDARAVGMLNLYLPAGSQLDDDTRRFLEGILNEVAVAVETLRFRSQELVTLQQLQMIRAPKVDLQSSLTQLLDQVQQALEADFSLLVVQSRGQPQPRMQLRRGRQAKDISPVMQSVIQRILANSQPVLITGVEDTVAFPNGRGALLAVPLVLANQPAFGAVLLGSDRPLGFSERQVSIFQAVAVQAALLLEYDRLMVDLEYNVIITERSRLAREIHDGLAQTLAFLKLQTGQMQTYLARGDMTRLEKALHTNYHALAEAYLDTRQSIDNLRLTPQLGLRQWLEQTLIDFRETTGIQSELSIPDSLRELPTEVQAQLIRIVQEALSNIRKHAHASQVWIAAGEWSGDLVLEVRDNGDGFSPDELPGISQYGLRGMRERAELISADFQIISQPSQGTTVRIRLPYPMEENLA